MRCGGVTHGDWVVQPLGHTLCFRWFILSASLIHALVALIFLRGSIGDELLQMNDEWMRTNEGPEGP